MKKFFSYIFTFIAVFFISAAATISLSVAGDTYTSPNNNAEGQGSSLSFLTNILETLNNGKNIYVDLGLSVEYENDVYELYINGGVDIKDSNNIKIDADLIVNINGNTKNITVNYYDNIAYLIIDDIKVKVNTKDLMDVLNNVISDDEFENSSDGESSAETGDDENKQSLDLGSLLEYIDLNGIMAALNNMEPVTEGTDTIYPLKQEGVIDAEIVMSEKNELKRLVVDEFSILGADLTLDATLNFNNNEIKKISDDSKYLDVLGFYDKLLKLKDIDNKSINVDGDLNYNGNKYQANVGLDFSKSKNYYSLDLNLSSLLDNEIKLDYLNNNLYLNVANINLMFDEQVIGLFTELLNQSDIAQFDLNSLIGDFSLPVINFELDLNVDNILYLLDCIIIDNNQIKVTADLNKIIGVEASGTIEIIFENNEIKSLYINGTYQGQSLNLNIEIADLEKIASVDEFDNYLNVRETLINNMNLLDIKAGNLDFDVNIKNLANEDVFSFDSVVNADSVNGLYSFESEFSGWLNGNLDIYYIGDVAYVCFNNVKICCSRKQAESIYNLYLKSLVENQTQKTNKIIDSIQEQLINKSSNFVSDFNLNTVLGLFNYLDSIIINKNLIQIDINEITEDSNIIVDFLLEKQEIKEFKLSNVNIGDYLIDIDTVIDKNGFVESKINESDYLNVVELLENTYNLKDIKYGSLSAIVELYQNNIYSKFNMNLDFDFQNLGDLYFNANILTEGITNIESNIVVYDGELYVNLFDNYIKLDIEKLGLLASILNINQDSISILSDGLKNQSFYNNIDYKSIDITKIISLIKNIEINTNIITLTIDGKVLESKDDIVVTINISNNNIQTISITNLKLNNNLFNIELSLDRKNPEKQVTNYDKYLKLETLINDAENKLEEFGINIPNIEELIFTGVSDIKPSIESTDLDTSLINITEVNKYIDLIKEFEINNKNIKIEIDAGIIQRTGKLFVSLDLINNCLNSASLKTNDGIDLSFTFNDKETNYININDIYNNILNLQNLRYGNISLTGSYSDLDTYYFGANVAFNFENLNDLFVNIGTEVWGAFEFDTDITLLDNELYVRIYDNYLNIPIEDLFAVIKLFGINKTENETNNYVDLQNINVNNILSSIKSFVVNNQSINLKIDLNFVGINTIVDLTLKIKNNDICGVIISNLNIDGHIINLDIELDKTRPEEKVDNQDNYLAVDELIIDANNVIENLGLTLSTENINTYTQSSNIDANSVVKDILGIECNVSSILNYLKITNITSRLISLDLQASVLNRTGLVFVDLYLNNSKLEYLTVTNNNDVNIEISFNREYKDKIYIFDLYENILSLADLKYGNVNINANYKYLGNEFLIQASADFDLSDFNNIYFNLLGNVTGKTNANLNVALMENQLFINLYDVFVKANMDDINYLLKSSGIDTNEIYNNIQKEIKNSDTSNFTIDNILKAIKKLKLTENEIQTTIDTSVFGLQTIINLTINIENNVITGISITDLDINGHKLSFDLTLNKYAPCQTIENSEKYLDMFKLVDNINDVIDNIRDIANYCVVSNTPKTVNQTGATDSDPITMVEKVLGFKISFENIVNYLSTVTINSYEINANINGQIIGKTGSISVNVNLNAGELDNVIITDGENISLSFALNDNHEDKLNIYTFIDNILKLQNLRYGNISGTGTYSNISDYYEFGLNIDFDFEDLEKLYLNAGIYTKGSLELDANLALYNDELFVKVYENYLNIDLLTVFEVLQSFGVDLNQTKEELSSIAGTIDFSSINIESIISAISTLLINNSEISLVIDGNVFGINSEINATILLNENDIEGIILDNLNINGQVISVNLKLNKSTPDKGVIESNKYLNIKSLINSAEEIMNSFGVETSSILSENIDASSNINIKETIKDIFGVELSLIGITDYLKTINIDSSKVSFKILGEILKRNSKLSIYVGLQDSEIEFITLNDNNGIDISLAFNGNYEDKINIYSVIKNVLDLQNLRFGNATISGIYNDGLSRYIFDLDGAFDFSDLSNIYLNTNVRISGGINVDSSLAIFNNEIYARLFETYLNVNIDELKSLIESLSIKTETIEVDTSDITKQFNKNLFTINRILLSIKNIEISKDAIHFIVDAGVFGIQTLINVTVKLSNDDVTGLKIQNLIIDGKIINLDIDLNKDKPEQFVDGVEHYLDAFTLVDDVKNVINNFNVLTNGMENKTNSAPLTMTENESLNIDIIPIIEEILRYELNASNVINYLKNIEVNSSKIYLNVKGKIINRENDLVIDINLKQSTLDSVSVSDGGDLDLVLAFNDNHNDKVNIYKFYDNIMSLMELREASLDAELSIYDKNETLMALNFDGSINVSEGNNYLSAFVRYVSGDLDLAANISHINNTFYIDYTDAKIKLTIESLLELISLQIGDKQNNEVNLIDLINYLLDNLMPSNETLSFDIDVNQILDIIAGINIAIISGDTIEIEISGDVINQDKELKVIITLCENDISKIELYQLKISDAQYIDIKANFKRTSVMPEINDSEYFDAYVAYNSILELFKNEDVTLQANGTVFNYDDINYSTEFDFNVDARKNVVDGKIGAYALANVLGANYGSRDYSFKLNYINDELFIDYNTLKAHLAKTAITNTVLSVIDLLGLERSSIETLLGSVEDLFEGVGLDEIFKELSGIDVGDINISIDETILNILQGLTLTTNGTTLGVVIDGKIIGIDGDIDLSLTTVDGKIRTIQFNKLGLGGKYVDATINVSPEVIDMPTLTQSEKDSYWNFSSLEELANMHYTTVNGIETFKLTGNVTLGLGSIEAADVPTVLYVNRDSNNKITLYGKLEIPTSSAAFKEYNGVYHIDARTTYIYYDGQYLYVHRIDKVRTSILVWNTSTKDYHFYGKIQFNYFNNDLYSALDFILGFSTTVSMFKSEFNKGGTTDTPPYIENIFLDYSYTKDSVNNKFNIKLSGDALIQNDKIGDIDLTINKNNQNGMIAGIYAKMTVVSIINVVANLSLVRFADSVEFNNSINSNIIPSSSNYKNDQLSWAF